MEAQRETVICVMGMSRSGTSLTTRILNLAGVYLGPAKRLLWHPRTNADGHWESRPMLTFNEWLLKSLGGTWRNPPDMPPGWERAPTLAKERCAARRFTEQTFGDRPLWGWKDPRNCLTLPFWQNLIPEMRYVICLRNPIDVASSLERRDGMSAEDAFALWLAYTDAALAGTEGHSRIVVPYESYFEDWRQQVDVLTAFAGARRPSEDPDLAKRVDRTIRRDLRHHGTPPEAVLADDRVPAGLASAYLALLDGSRISPMAPGAGRT
jgi:hypothetical protein